MRTMRMPVTVRTLQSVIMVSAFLFFSNTAYAPVFATYPRILTYNASCIAVPEHMPDTGPSMTTTPIVSILDFQSGTFCIAVVI